MKGKALIEPDDRSLLLDPSAWQPGLGKYARAVNLAVALVDTDGKLLGKCVNPQPLWSFLRANQPLNEGGCPFWLAPPRPCTCFVQALEKGSVVIVRDQTGLVHFAVPLTLDEHGLGALIAGQVFDHYPEPMVLEHVARQFNVSPSECWHLARRAIPIRGATLTTYAELLETLGRTFLRTSYNTIALLKADEQKDKFLGTLSHELRSPLGAISNAVRILKQVGIDDDERLVQARAIIERQTSHLSRLVDELLDVSRISSGKIAIHPEPVDLKNLVDLSLQTQRGAIEARGHTVSVSHPTEAVIVEGDPVRLEQVIVNLLNNAVKYTQPGGRIGLSVQREGGEAIFKIRDTGRGISPEMLPRLFQRYLQVDAAQQDSEGGLGIGLSLVRSLVELHGGSVSAFSEGPGRGSEFVVVLPLLTAPEPEGTPKPETTQETKEQLSPARRILLVDDDPNNRLMLQVSLEAAGHQVQTASNGTEAIKMSLTHPPEVALIDIGLPDVDGYEVASQVRAAPGGDKIFLIACTGYGGAENRRRAMEAGFDTHLVKPVDLDELADLLAYR